MESEKAIQRMVDVGVRIIKWKDLTVKRLIGGGNFGDVYEGKRISHLHKPPQVL